MKTGRWLALLCAVGVGFVVVSCDDEMPTEPEVTTPTITETAPLLTVLAAADIGQCMGNDAVEFNEYVSGFSSNTAPTAFNCTAGDVSLANAHVAGGTGPIECVGGETKTVDIVADVVLNSESARTDIGIWVADATLNPESAETGTCNFFNLPQGITGGISDADADNCGDMDNAGTVSDFALDQISFLCEDPDQDGFVEIASCVSWTQPGGDRVCPVPTDNFRAGTLPANKSKCNCEPFLIPVTILAQLTLVKTVDNDDGGTATQSDFQAKIDGGDVPWDVAQELTAGDYTASETVFAGYTAGDWGGDCAADGSVTLAPGDNKTCTITNSDNPAFLTLVKTVTNDDGGTATQANFQAKIDDGNVAWDSKESVGAGAHTASETVFAGYTASVWGGDCEEDGTITLALGDDKTCTITNDDNPAGLILNKIVTNDDGGTAEADDFQAKIDGGDVPWATSQSVGAGTFTASEVGVTGYTASVWSGDCAADGTVTIALGENKTCSITNDDDPAFLTLVKTVTNDDGGTATQANFQAKIDGGNVAWDSKESVGAGAHTASETVFAGYTAGSWGGDCAADGTITLALGDDKTCTITNDDNPATLTLNKIVTNDDGGTATQANFQAKIDGGDVPWATAQSVGAGTFTASEVGVTGYTASVWSGDCAADGTVTIALGENKTCTITNDDDPATLTLNKIVTNDDGGTATQANFQAKIDGGDVPWATAQSVGAGTFTASETVFAGYTAGSWGGDCAADGTVTLALGDNKTCTITNDDDPAFLTLEKTVINDDGGGAVADDFQARIDGGAVPWFSAQSVGAGSFTASEDLVSGYTAGVWGGDCAADGSVSLAIGDNKTCSITNDDVATCNPGDRLTSVTLEVTASSGSFQFDVTDDNGNMGSADALSPPSPISSAVGTQFIVVPSGGTFFDSQNLRFWIDGVVAKNLKVHLSCSDDPAVGDIHIGDADGNSLTLRKVAFATTQF